MRQRQTAAFLQDLADLLLPTDIGAALVAMACRAMLLLLAVLLAMLLGACAALPSQVQRVPSEAHTETQDTPLAAIVRASTPAQAEALSGFRLLPAGDQAFEARIALVRTATKTLDLQYYQFAHDRSGLQLIAALRDAASRGVRVRLLVDDLYAVGQDGLLAALDHQAQVEVRLFNPLPARDAGFTARIALSLHEFGRINRRMHNKLFIADNQVSISGGRNIADEYFGRADPAFFIDLDILATGPVAQQQSQVFDRFWNSPQAYPVASLLSPSIDLQDEVRELARRLADATETLPIPAADALGQSSIGEQLAAGRLELHFAAAHVVADEPSKAEPANEGQTGAVAAAHAALLHSARHEVLIATPYFVPGADGLAEFEGAAQRQVQLSVLTNSLATTDEPLVHMGYARYRHPLLKMGVKLYELMPSFTGAAESRPGSKANEHRSSLGRLHAKVSVVDQRWVYIGSMNLDRRSALTNTECGLIIDSQALASEAKVLMENNSAHQSYGLRLQEAKGRQQIEWISALEGVRGSEPLRSPIHDLGLAIGSLLIAEEHL